MNRLKEEGVFAFCRPITPITPEPPDSKKLNKVPQKEEAYV